MKIDVKKIPYFPKDQEGPVFSAPWAARAFAMTLELHDAGCFSWPEWVACFSEELNSSEHGKHAMDGDVDDYYECWVDALEKILAHKDLVSGTSLRASLDATLANWPAPNHEAKRDPVARSASGIETSE